MCVMCVEIFKGRMTISEGRKALSELVATTQDPELLKHYEELADAEEQEMKKLISDYNKTNSIS